MYKLLGSEKFHDMNATVKTVRFEDGTVVKRLLSYDSIVCDIDMKNKNVYLYPRHQYSPTTIRQLTRFLNEYVPLTHTFWFIALIRDLRKKADSDGYVSLGRYGVFFLEHVLGTDRGW